MSETTRKAIYEQGQSARLVGVPFWVCPYLFSTVGVDQETFDRDYRWKLNAWFDGWAGR